MTTAQITLFINIMVFLEIDTSLVLFWSVFPYESKLVELQLLCPILPKEINLFSIQEQS